MRRPPESNRSRPPSRRAPSPRPRATRQRSRPSPRSRRRARARHRGGTRSIRSRRPCRANAAPRTPTAISISPTSSSNMLRSRFVIPGSRTAHVAFTDRHGGYSSGDFASFNLARHVGDDDELVAANRAALAQVPAPSGERLASVAPVHGTTGRTISDGAELRPGPVGAGAHFTNLTGIGLAIMVADCTPAMLADPEVGLIAAVHAGRQGMAAGVVPTTLAAMREAGADRIHAVIGPSVCPRCHQVPAELPPEVAPI